MTVALPRTGVDARIDRLRFVLSVDGGDGGDRDRDMIGSGGLCNYIFTMTLRATFRTV